MPPRTRGALHAHTNRYHATCKQCPAITGTLGHVDPPTCMCLSVGAMCHACHDLSLFVDEVVVRGFGKVLSGELREEKAWREQYLRSEVHLSKEKGGRSRGGAVVASYKLQCKTLSQQWN